MGDHVMKCLNEQVAMASDQVLNLTHDSSRDLATGRQDHAVVEPNGERETWPTYRCVRETMPLLCIEVDRPAAITAHKRGAHRAQYDEGLLHLVSAK